MALLPSETPGAKAILWPTELLACTAVPAAQIFASGPMASASSEGSGFRVVFFWVDSTHLLPSYFINLFSAYRILRSDNLISFHSVCVHFSLS
jgi:hypothetical protein